MRDIDSLSRRHFVSFNGQSKSSGVGSLELTYICEIVPEKNVCGAIKEYSPHKKYINAAVAKIHKFGMGPFCKFRIPANLNLAGVMQLKLRIL